MVGAVLQTLDRVNLGQPVLIQSVTGEAAQVRRLAELGIRRGALVSVRHVTAGGGRVIDVAGSRIAVARSVLATVEGEVTP